MLGLNLNIWTDVRGTSKGSGSAVTANPASGTVTARSTGKSVTSGGTLTYTPIPVTATANVNIVTTTIG